MIACILPGACERPLSLFGKTRQARYCGNYSLSVEISGFTFDGNLTTSSFKIRAVGEGRLTSDRKVRNWLKVVVKPVLAQKAACSEGRNPQQPMGPSGGMVDAGDSKDPNPQKYMIKY